MCFLLTKSGKPIPPFLRNQGDNTLNDSRKRRKFVKRTKYRRKVRQLNKKVNCLVSNYSDLELNKDMVSLLNRGLNFAVVPKTVNTTDVHAGFEKLERDMKWTETLFKEDDLENDSSVYKKKPWRPSKTNLPKTAPSADLSTFLSGSLTCVLGSDLNKIHTNLPENEKRAMNEIVHLQKERIITLKPNDKTGGVSVLNTEDYIKSMDYLLHAKHTDSDGVDHPYFHRLDPNQADQMQFNDLDRLKSEVSKAKNEGWTDTTWLLGWYLRSQPLADSMV